MKDRDPNYEMPRGKLVPIPNFLPPPSELIFPEDTVKITISLKRDSINFFKREAQRNHTKYQKMIREVLDRYATHHSRKTKA